jgi:hypothetical protein
MTLNIPNIKINEKSTQWKAAVTSSMESSSYLINETEKRKGKRAKSSQEM